MFEIFPTDDPVAVDLAHATLLLGAVASLKPSIVLELGIGSGHTARAILQALKWNQTGHLTAVDNWHDWHGQEPPVAGQLRDAGADVIVSDEDVFVKSTPANAFDLLVSDADHQRSDQWLQDHLRVVRPGGLLFFHDTNNQDFPNLGRVVAQVEALKLPHVHFTQSSRPDERCGRGWLMVVNKKPRIALVTAWDALAAEIGDLTWPNRRAYCDRHGYALRGGLVPLAHHWVKLPALQAALDEGFEWVVWMDADAVITNPARRLEEFLDDTADLVASYDMNGLNNGVQFWRNSPWTKCMIGEWDQNGIRYARHPSPEQTTLAYLLYREPKEKWKVVPQKAFNAYDYREYPGLVWPEGQWQPGDFVLHLPGLTDARRAEIIRPLLAS